MLGHFFLQCTFDLIRAHEHLVDVAELGEQFHGRLLAHARTAREVVGRVAHECQQVDHLSGALQTILGRYLVGTHRLVTTAMAGPELIHMTAHQLAIVLVGGEHIGVNTDGIGLFCQCTNHVVGFEAIGLEDGDAHGAQDIFDDRHTHADVFWCLLALRFIGGERLAAEGGSVGIESHAQVGGLFLGHHLVQGVHETHDG